MTDCPNAQMRDRLPDVLHARLDESALAAVMAHVGECADCRAELALLRAMRVSLVSGAAVDSAAIARAVVTRTITVPPAAAGGWRWSDWRLAAAIAVLAVGGASFAAFHAKGAPNDRPLDTVHVAVGTEPPAPSVTPAPSAAAPGVPRRVEEAAKAAPTARAELVAAGDVADLSDSDLRTLLGDLDTIEAVPPTEPEPVTVRVSLPERGGTR